jgi:hypothetical protein
LPHSSGFPAAFSLIFLIFLTHCVAETHLVLPCAQVHVMRCLMSSAMVVVWIVAGAAQKLSINSTKQQTAALLPPCPPCRPAGQGASPCARVRAMQPAKALYYSMQKGPSWPAHARRRVGGRNAHDASTPRRKVKTPQDSVAAVQGLSSCVLLYLGVAIPGIASSA